MKLAIALTLVTSYVAAAELTYPSQVDCSSDFADCPFCDHSLPKETRVASYLDSLTLTDKVALLGDGSCGDDLTTPKLRLPFGEGLHGVCSDCVGVCPTSFPHALSLAASFNRTLWHKVGTAVGKEARSLNNLNASAAVGPVTPETPSGIFLWSPNLNPYRGESEP